MLQLVLKPLRWHHDTPNTPSSVKFIHELQRLNELQNLIPLAIQHQLPETEAARVQTSSQAVTRVECIQNLQVWRPIRLPEEEHVVRVQPVDDAALLLKRQHADVQLPRVEKVQDDFNDLHLLHIDGFFHCHGDDGLPMIIMAEMLKTFRRWQGTIQKFCLMLNLWQRPEALQNKNTTGMNKWWPEEQKALFPSRYEEAILQWWHAW